MSIDEGIKRTEEFYARIDTILAKAGCPVGVGVVDREKSTPDKLVLLGKDRIGPRTKAAIVMGLTEIDLDADPSASAVLGLASELTAEAVEAVQQTLQGRVTAAGPTLAETYGFPQAGWNDVYDRYDAAFAKHKVAAVVDRMLSIQDSIIINLTVKDRRWNAAETTLFDRAMWEATHPTAPAAGVTLDPEKAKKIAENVPPEIGVPPKPDDGPWVFRLAQIPVDYYLAGRSDRDYVKLRDELYQWGYINLDAEGNPSVLSGKPPVVPYDTKAFFKCPRGEEDGRADQQAVWTLDRNTCSYCGSMNPDELMGLLETGEAELSPTDKDYKVYVQRANPRFGKQRISGSSTHPRLPYVLLTEEKYRAAVADGACMAKDYLPGAFVRWDPEPAKTYEKFYFQHLSPAQRMRFVELLNEKKLYINEPGRFYRLPFFCVAGTEAASA